MTTKQETMKLFKIDKQNLRILKWQLALLSIALIWGCQNVPKEPSNKINDPIEKETQQKSHWSAPLIQEYINSSDNVFMTQARKYSLDTEWLFDQVMNSDSDSTPYYVFQIGRTVMDSPQINARYVTDVWLYIDTVSRQVYEYDLPADSLIPWR